jgi:hypothetical protein
MAMVKEIALALTGAVAIVAGLALYAVFRPARIHLIPSALHLAEAGAAAPVVLSAVPSVIHAFAMPLLTAACLRLRRRQVVMACVTWGAIDLVFELGQRSGISLFPGGTFDPLDLAGVLLGTTLAGAVGLAILRSQS